jgi:sulfur carrier protein
MPPSTKVSRFRLGISLMIQITVNGQSIEISSPMTVEQMLETVDVPPNYLAVEVNAEVVPREHYSQRIVGAGDDVELVTLVGGG